MKIPDGYVKLTLIDGRALFYALINHRVRKGKRGALTAEEAWIICQYPLRRIFHS
jgi:hypothetical protein